MLWVQLMYAALLSEHAVMDKPVPADQSPPSPKQAVLLQIRAVSYAHLVGVGVGPRTVHCVRADISATPTCTPRIAQLSGACPECWSMRPSATSSGLLGAGAPSPRAAVGFAVAAADCSVDCSAESLFFSLEMTQVHTLYTRGPGSFRAHRLPPLTSTTWVLDCMSEVLSQRQVHVYLSL
eukprot:scaffold94660_cov68-Phaeocystis_antarctica.AAC.2